MKKTFTLIVLSIFTLSIWAQSPNKLSYQAVVRDAGDNIISEQAVGMQISILQSSASGTAVYTETHNPTTNANGLVTVEIGGGATADDFSAIDWAAGPYFIKTEIDPAGGTSYTITGTSQLLSVPYAKYADEAGNVFSGSYADLTDVPANIDTDASDDFDGDYTSLTNTPDLSVYATETYVDAQTTGIAHSAATPLNNYRSLYSSTTAIDSVKINVPSAGYVFVTGTLSAAISHTQGIEDELYFVVTDTKDELSYSKTGFAQVRVPSELPTNTGASTNYGYPVTCVGVFKVTTSGEKTFYFNSKFASGFDANDRFIDAYLTAIFVPVAYGDVFE